MAQVYINSIEIYFMLPLEKKLKSDSKVLVLEEYEKQEITLLSYLQGSLIWRIYT